MNTDFKKIVFIFGGGLILFWAFKKIKPIGATKKGSNTTKSTPKIVTEEDKKNAVIIMSAYADAKKAGESKSFLDEMNAEFSKEFKMKVYTDRGSGKLFAADLEGDKII